MKLFELTGIKKYADQHLANILNAFIEKKQIKVRSGGFAFVIIPKDKDYVFKVWLKDPGFETYLKFIKNHSGDKHFPKVIGDVHDVPMFFKRDAKAGDTMKVVRLEKLEPFPHGDVREGMLDYVVSRLRKLKIASLTDADVPELIKKFKIDKPTASLYGVPRTVQPDELNALLGKSESLLKAMIAVWKELGPNNPSIGEDLAGNIMLRGDVPVIVDPYYTKHMWDVTASDLINPDTKRPPASFKSGRTK